MMMRKTKEIILEAFQKGIAKKVHNTKVVIEDKKVKLLLYGHCIAEKINKHVYVDTCGWMTVTTKERLNIIPGVSVRASKGIWYLNNREWNGTRKMVY